jgi:hypothetical protein
VAFVDGEAEGVDGALPSVRGAEDVVDVVVPAASGEGFGGGGVDAVAFGKFFLEILRRGMGPTPDAAGRVVFVFVGDRDLGTGGEGLGPVMADADGPLAPVFLAALKAEVVLQQAGVNEGLERGVGKGLECFFGGARDRGSGGHRLGGGGR